MSNNCPGCMDENNFCLEHQKNEKDVFERYTNHNTQEFRMAIYDAREKDLRGE